MSLLSIENLTFYLPFPDGVLDYVCAECDAHCCRGYGFGGSLAREMTNLLSWYPALESLVISRRGDIISLQNSAGRCFFLQDNLHCRIEETHGKQAKPGVCGLFPFNKMSRLSEDIIVIAPHFLCPLRVVLPRSEKVEGGHQKVIQAVKDSFLLDSAYFAANFEPRPLAAKQTPLAALQQEVSFRDHCGEALQQKKKFFEVLAQHSQDAEALRRFVPRVALLCGVAYVAVKERDYLDDILLAMASSWRVEMLPLGQERMLRVLALSEVLLRRVTLLSERPLTPKQVHQFYQDFSSALRFLSREESPMLLPKALQKVPSFGSPQLTFAAYRVLRGAEKNVLSSLEEVFTPELAGSDRMAILSELGLLTERAKLPKTKKPQ